MKITKVSIHHWRSIRDLEMDCQPLTVLLGPNNHGKSNVLDAIGFVLTASEKPSPEDFFEKRAIDADTADELWVELTFERLSEQERSTFKRYVGSDGRLRVRKTATLENGKVSVRYNGWLSQPKDEWLRSGYRPKRPDLHPKLEPYLPSGNYSQRLIEAAQQAYIAAHRDELDFEYELEAGPFLGQKNVAAGTLPEWFLIPAVRDLTDEIRTKSTATFGRLLARAVEEMAAHDPKVREVRKGLEEMVRHLNEGEERPAQLAVLESAIQQEMKGWDAILKIVVTPPDISKLFEGGTSLLVDDGVSTPAERKGSGMQRALMFALTQAWVRIRRGTSPTTGSDPKPRAASNTAILAIEEPELYLHPHAERRFYRNLLELAEEEDHQVFLSTHSTHFVDLDRPRSICILRKPDAETGTQVRQCKEDLFSGDRKKQFKAAYWVDPNRGEMLFARRVAFVEGATEATLFPFLARKLGCFDPEVSVIDCGGKGNLLLYAELAKAFGLDYVVVYDEDPVPPGLQGDKLESAQRTFELNEEIERLVGDKARCLMVSPNIEGHAQIPRTRGKKVGKPLAAIEHFGGDVPVPERLQEVVRAIYGGNA